MIQPLSGILKNAIPRSKAGIAFLLLTLLGILPCCNTDSNSTSAPSGTENISMTFDTVPNSFEILQEMVDSNDEILFAEPGKSVETVVIEDDTFFIVEGDMLLDKLEFWQYLFNDPSKQYRIKTDGYSPKMVGEIDAYGDTVKWPAGTVLRYAIIKETFLHKENYDSVVSWMLEATKDWSDSCGIRFNYVAAYDNFRYFDNNRSVPDDLTFIVREYEASGKFEAEAFFPDEEPQKRKMCIDPSLYRDRTYSKPGVLRHEIGHILGFLHQHVSDLSPFNCWRSTDRPGQSINLTYQYDTFSVMHSICVDKSARQLKLTYLDAKGARCLYPF